MSNGRGRVVRGVRLDTGQRNKRGTTTREQWISAVHEDRSSRLKAPAPSIVIPRPFSLFLLFAVSLSLESRGKKQMPGKSCSHCANSSSPRPFSWCVCARREQCAE